MLSLIHYIYTRPLLGTGMLFALVTGCITNVHKNEQNFLYKQDDGKAKETWKQSLTRILNEANNMNDLLTLK